MVDVQHNYRSGLGRQELVALSFLALGVVYGDIGTSPLYAVQLAFRGKVDLVISQANVLGVLSLIFWALILAISVKYVAFILSADNHGEGGTLSMIALIQPASGKTPRAVAVLVALAIFGASLLYGDGMITPAISVLSAVEGLKVVLPSLSTSVVPITVVILAGLFLLQSRGTAGVGRFFAPILLIWFVVLAVLGLRAIALDPEVLRAVDPVYAGRFLVHNGFVGFLTLGAVVLVITGGEALYADMGHFTAKAIRLTWFSLVLPALVLNYFGQGALLLSDPAAAANPFYGLAAAGPLRDGLLVLATMATIIASQAVISGVFSLTKQAIQLGYAPRLAVEHTSSRHMGQIYLSTINWIMMVATILLVLGFGSSSRLAAAYGIAVTGAMSITSLVFYRVAVARWHWKPWLAGPLVAGFLTIDLTFLTSNLDKIVSGGEVPLLIAGLAAFLLSTWKRGQTAVHSELYKQSQSIEEFLEHVHELTRVPGTAVYLSRHVDRIPPVLIHNTQRNRVLHEQVILLSVVTRDVPYVLPLSRLEVDRFGAGTVHVRVFYGFMQTPDIPKTLELLHSYDVNVDPGEVTYFVGSDKAIPSSWRMKVYAVIARNTQRFTEFLHIPHEQTLEVGSHIEI